MADQDLIRTLDLCDSYVESNQRLALTLKHCFFSLAQIRYSAGHGTAVLSDKSSAPALLRVDLQEGAPTFTLQYPAGRHGAKSTQKFAISSSEETERPESLRDTPPAEAGQSVAADGRKSLADQDAQAGEFSSLISELAEKYGCGRQETGESGGEDEEGAREERVFMPPQLRAAQGKFKEALQLAIQVVNCRAQLQRLLQSGNG